MFLSRVVLIFSLVATNGAAFMANARVGRAGDTVAIKPVSTPFVHQEQPTSLHVGVSYGPPAIMDEQRRNNILNRRNNRLDTNFQNFFDVDPAFRAVSIAYNYDMEAEHKELQRRKAIRSIAGSTALVSALLLGKSLISSGVLPYLLSQLPHFYMAYPLQASVATCGLNSAVADTISQVLSLKKGGGMYQKRQLLSSVCYGSLCLGVGSSIVYTKLLPLMLAGTSGITNILGSALLDNFCFAPLIWLPSAYAVKAFFHGQCVKTSLIQYFQAVRKEQLLHKYATFWLPAQILNFALVPKHLRVATTAGFSFVWFLILTSITSKSKTA